MDDESLRALLKLAVFSTSVVGFGFLIGSIYSSIRLWFHAKKSILVPFYVLPFYSDASLDSVSQRYKKLARKLFICFILAMLFSVFMMFSGVASLEKLKKFHEKGGEIHLFNNE
ncbi:MAG: hypothetical protein AAF530_08500 [Pseudomonadota bacterium]